MAGNKSDTLNQYILVVAVLVAVKVVPAGLKLKAGAACVVGNKLKFVDGVPLGKVGAAAVVAAVVEAAGVAVPTKLKADCWVVVVVGPPKNKKSFNSANNMGH